MKTVKQVLIKENEISLESDSKILESLVTIGLLEETKLNLVKRAMFTNVSAMTMAEKKALVSLMESLISNVLYEKQDHLSAFDPKRPAGYPSEKNIPVVLILKRKAIRVYPDNQKIALYYSQALDKYISIPFGPKTDELGIHMNEETQKEMTKIKFSMNESRESVPVSKESSFKRNLEQIRESKKEEIDENLISLGANILSKAGPALSRAGSLVGTAAKTATKKSSRFVRRNTLRAIRNVRDNKPENPDLDMSDVKRKPDGDYQFSQAGRPAPPVDNPIPRNRVSPGVPTSTDIISQRRLWGNPTNESTNFDRIKTLVENDLSKSDLKFGDESISINNRIANKVLNVHESLNKKNKKKFEKMINENLVSFKKAINFVVKAR